MSHHHTKLDQRRWAHVRRRALARAGWKSELSGKRGRLEVHHLRSLEEGGDLYTLDNLQVLTRAEHVEVTRQQNRRPLTPEERKWQNLLAAMLARR